MRGSFLFVFCRHYTKAAESRFHIFTLALSPGVCVYRLAGNGDRSADFSPQEGWLAKGHRDFPTRVCGPALLRDKSRAPCQFLARTVDTVPLGGERGNLIGVRFDRLDSFEQPGFGIVEKQSGEANCQRPVLSEASKKTNLQNMSIRIAWCGSCN